MEIWIIRKNAMCLRIPDSNYFRMNIKIYKVMCIYIYIHNSYTCVIMRGMLVYEWWHVGSIIFQLVFHAISSLWNPNWGNPKWMDPIPPRWSPERLFGVVYTFKWSSWIDLGMVYGIDHGFTNYIQLCSFCVPILAHTCTILYHNQLFGNPRHPFHGLC
jgi:hypothetical protein